MPYEKLVKYIKEQLSDGYTKDQIIEVLQKSGYKQAMIDKGFTLFDAEQEHKPESAKKKTIPQEPTVKDDLELPLNMLDEHELQELVEKHALSPEPNAAKPEHNHKPLHEVHFHDGPPRYNTMALWSFLLMATIVLIPLAFLFSGIALWQLGHRYHGEKGKWLALFCLLLSFFIMAVPIVFFILVLGPYGNMLGVDVGQMTSMLQELVGQYVGYVQ